MTVPLSKSEKNPANLEKAFDIEVQKYHKTDGFCVALHVFLMKVA